MYEEISPRGEYVLCVHGADPDAAPEADPDEALAAVLALRGEGLSLKESSRRIAEKTGISRKALYDAALKRQEEEKYE